LGFENAGVDGCNDDRKNAFIDYRASPIEFGFKSGQPGVSEQYFFVSNVGD
jgi:hypothetical protein